MSEPTTTATTCVGKFKAIFGTSHASKTLGFIVKSHNCSEAADTNDLKDEDGNTCFRQYTNKHWTGTITGTPILGAANDDKYTAAREALAVGATFTVPKNKGITRPVSGLPIITGIDESTSSEGLAEITINYEINPNLTQKLESDNLAGEEEKDEGENATA